MESLSVSQICKDMIDVEVLCSITYRDPMAAELIELMFLDASLPGQWSCPMLNKNSFSRKKIILIETFMSKKVTF